MTVVRGAAAVPAAPVLLPAASPQQPEADRGQVARLRARVDRLLGDLPEVDVVVLVAPGPRGVHDRAHASLGQLGVVADELTLPVDRRLLPHVTRLTQYPLAVGGSLGVEHTVLARLLHAARGPVDVLPVAVAPSTRGEVLVNVGASLVESLRDADRTAVVVAASDLSAGLEGHSPGALVDGAAAWDRLAVRAFSTGAPEGLSALGPAEAARVRAVGWASLTVLLGVAAAARLEVTGDLGYDVVRGVGRLTGRLRAAGSGPAATPGGQGAGSAGSGTAGP